MAKIFLTKDEGEAWGLVPKKMFDMSKMREKILIRVLAGVIVFLLVLIIGLSGPTISGTLTAITG